MGQISPKLLSASCTRVKNQDVTLEWILSKSTMEFIYIIFIYLHIHIFWKITADNSANLNL